MTVAQDRVESPVTIEGVAAEQDPYVGAEVLAWRSAERCGARVVVLEGRGHWWMCEDPALGARVLDEVFASLA